jgi:enoyl-CoA hydratase/carnithine racemase
MESGVSEHVQIGDQDGVRTITMNRLAKRNALTAAMYSTMAEALEQADSDTSVGAVLFLGGPGCFTSGNDVKDFLVNPPTGPESAVFRFLRALLACGAPLVAAVDGPAVGVGTTMLLHCDLVYATPAARLHLPFIDLGLVPEAGSSLLLPQTLGHRQAAEMLMLGTPIDGVRAAAIGLINAVVPADELSTVAAAAAAALAAKPRTALRHTKALMRANRPEVAAAMDRESTLFGELLRSPEAIAAFQAFLMKSVSRA